ncbi:hypothetical protein ACFSJW_23455 [Flavobacterium artemisiae]|uniref:Uncharacterized protein n=1 Tax=Flavobacterium artemisiae TaxID=2126556 RepID=A0ABW4H7K7_9FLAO
MKHLLFLLLLAAGARCTNPKTFVLDDTEENKYFAAKFINNVFEQNLIDKSPLIVINGIPFKYNKEKDTVVLPIKKSDILNLGFLNKNSSRIIYNEKENDGAILITTKSKTKN